MTGVVLDALGIIHLQAGNTFEVPGRQFFVEDACSGIHSLLSIVGVALLWSVYLRLPVLASLCAVACAGSAAIALNVFRVLAVVIGYTRWNLDLSKGWLHEVLGSMLFVVAVLFLGSAQQFWRFWLCATADESTSTHGQASGSGGCVTAGRATDDVANLSTAGGDWTRAVGPTTGVQFPRRLCRSNSAFVLCRQSDGTAS